MYADGDPAPFTDGVRYKIWTPSPDYWSNDLYMGEPRDESEYAWNELIHRCVISYGSSMN